MLPSRRKALNVFFYYAEGKGAVSFLRLDGSLYNFRRRIFSAHRLVSRIISIVCKIKF